MNVEVNLVQEFREIFELVKMLIERVYVIHQRVEALEAKAKKDESSKPD